MTTRSIKKTVPPDTNLPDYIFYKFDSLQPGNGFIIQQENDPHSIYSQMLKEKGDTFSWEYLTVGPKQWCVKISKKDKELASETIGELALSDYRKAIILRKYGLDYSFKGSQTLKEACTEKMISSENVEWELAAAHKHPLVYTVNYNSWELDYLTDFIVTNHHQYTRKTLAFIANEFDKHVTTINRDHANLLPLVEVFRQLNIGMTIMMRHEEQVLFPFIRFLVHVMRSNVVGKSAMPAGSVKAHIRKIEAEQLKIGEQVNYLRKFTNNYRMPVITHPFYTEVLQQLNEFDNDLHQHIHIENNILFRKALLLEEEYLADARSCNSQPGIQNPENNYLSSLL